MEIISVYLKSTHITRKLVKSAGQLYLAVGSLREDKKLEQGELGVQTDVTWRAKTPNSERSRLFIYYPAVVAGLPEPSGSN